MLPFAGFMTGLWICLASLQAGQISPTPVKTVTEERFYVAGYLVRTNNARETRGHSAIGDLWQRFVEEKAGAKMPDRVDSKTYAVYSNYDTDEKGDYDYLLGARVKSVEHLPEGMTFRMVIPGKYAVVTTDRGSMTKVLKAAWQKIWAMDAAQLGGKRAFVTDYEVYDERSVHPEHAEIEIHVGLKP